MYNICILYVLYMYKIFVIYMYNACMYICIIYMHNKIVNFPKF